jgi:hypothetical protein
MTAPPAGPRDGEKRKRCREFVMALEHPDWPVLVPRECRRFAVPGTGYCYQHQPAQFALNDLDHLAGCAARHCAARGDGE